MKRLVPILDWINLGLLCASEDERCAVELIILVAVLMMICEPVN
jgi:hypothetical protein